MSFNITATSKVVTISGTYNITKADSVGTVFIADDSSAVVFNLPLASSVIAGTYYTIKKQGGSGTVSINGSGSDTIDGSAAKVISGSQIWDTYTIASDGVDKWYFLSFGAS
jgi:hypothetical protein